MTATPKHSLARRIALVVGSLCFCFTFAGVAVLRLALPPPVRVGAVVGVLALVALLVATGTALTVRKLLLAPLRATLDVLGHAVQGDYLVRAATQRPQAVGEIGELGAGVNKLLAKITDLQVNAIDADRALVSAQRELSLTNELAEKARIIQEQAQQTQARVRELELIISATETVSSRLDLPGVLRVLVEKAGRTLGFEECAILLRDEASGQYVVRATWGFSDAAAIEGMGFLAGEGITGLVAQTGETLLIEDTSRDERYLHYKGRHLVDGAFACIPIFNPRSAPATSDGLRLLGLFNVLRPRSLGFREADLRLLNALARHAALAIANAELLTRLERLSVTDDLTGLANRRLFNARAELEMKRITSGEGRLSVLMLDIDHFKRFNDTHGHHEGDTVLRRVASMLSTEMRGTELLARWGGEEFIALLPDVDARGALARAERMRRAVAEDSAHLTLSIGVSSFPEDGRDVEQLIGRSDEAMFAAKRGGRDRVVAHHALAVHVAS